MNDLVTRGGLLGSDFETHPIGTADRIVELERTIEHLEATIRFAEIAKESNIERIAELMAELDKRTPYGLRYLNRK